MYPVLYCTALYTYTLHMISTLNRYLVYHSKGIAGSNQTSLAVVWLHNPDPLQADESCSSKAINILVLTAALVPETSLPFFHLVR